jgi:hypothetical protein
MKSINKTQNKQRNNKRRVVPKRGNTTTINGIDRGTIVVPRNLSSYAADSYLCTLKYTSFDTTRGASGTTYAYWRFRMNSVFDPDPLVLSGSISGFNEIASIYRRYLVTDFEFMVEITNLETFPVTIIIAPSDIDLATQIVTRAAAVNMSEYPLASRRTLSAKGGQDRALLMKKFNLARFSGQPSAYVDSLAYSSLSNTNPSILTFINFAIVADSNLANGVYMTTTLKFRTKWSERQTPNL